MTDHSVFEGLNTGDPSFGARHPFLLEGDYKLNIESVSLRGRQKPLFVIEASILESSNPERPVGMICACFIDMSNRDTRGKHVTGFIAAVYGTEPTSLPKDSTTTPWDNQPWSSYASWITSEQNPFKGKQVGCRVNVVKTKAADDFSLHTWVPFASMKVAQTRYAAAQAPVLAGAGFQAPAPQPGVAPQGWAGPAAAPQAALPQAAPAAPLGGFQPPAAAQAPQAAPPAGWSGGVAPASPAAWNGGATR